MFQPNLKEPMESQWDRPQAFLKERGANTSCEAEQGSSSPRSLKTVTQTPLLEIPHLYEFLRHPFSMMLLAKKKK